MAAGGFAEDRSVAPVLGVDRLRSSELLCFPLTRPGGM